MEVLLFAAGLGALILIIRSGTPKSGAKHSEPNPNLGQSSSRQPPSQVKYNEPSRFDETTAVRPHHRRTLSGLAWVTDGDTIKIGSVQIRLFGIDAPELNHPYGKKAKWALHKLCKGNSVRAEITEVDKYGRTVARCYQSDGRDLSAEMVKLGLALDWPKFSGGKYRELETSDARTKLILADARQKGRMHLWETFDTRRRKN